MSGWIWVWERCSQVSWPWIGLTELFWAVCLWCRDGLTFVGHNRVYNNIEHQERCLSPHWHYGLWMIAVIENLQKREAKESFGIDIAVYWSRWNVKDDQDVQFSLWATISVAPSSCPFTALPQKYGRQSGPDQLKAKLMCNKIVLNTFLSNVVQ